MRKLLSAVFGLVVSAGLVVAAEVTLVKYDKDKKELTVKDKAGKESVYKVTDKTTVTTYNKDLNYEDKSFDRFEAKLASPKAAGLLKFEITTEKYTVKNIKFPIRR